MSEIPYFRIARMQDGICAINSAYRGCNCSKRGAGSNLSFRFSLALTIKGGDMKYWGRWGVLAVVCLFLKLCACTNIISEIFYITLMISLKIFTCSVNMKNLMIKK